MKDKISVLMVGYEAAPFYKRGGLGDVMESLPKALASIGIEARVVIPYYKDIKDKYHFEKEGEFTFVYDDKKESVGIFSTNLSSKSSGHSVNIPFYFLENRNYLSLSNTKYKNKRIGQFAFFDLAIIKLTHWLGQHHRWSPSVIHCNDWHTGLIPLILNKMKMKISTILTIHNLLYQGVGSLKVLDLLGIEDQQAKVLKKGVPASEMNVLGEGIVHATRVSTVSPSYAKEIVQQEHDQNPISPYLMEREHRGLGKFGKVIGILNGIDYDIWNPAIDESIFHKYDMSNWETGKKDNKRDLLRDLDLADRPTFCFIGRMANQKGIDILIKVIDELESLGINVIILGAGSLLIEENVLKLAQKHPGWIRAEPIYSEELAHKLYASSDFIIIPSRYEPCGLIQMVAMKYGTIPIASKTGGLKDSIANGKDGILFEKGKSIRLKKAIRYALNIQQDKVRFKKMVQSAMRKDFSWDKSAVLYKKLYKDMIKSSKAEA